jgi:cold shock CspA family protein
VPLSQDGKSSLDCYLTVNAMKLFFQNENIDTLILASGDRDYIPLIAELKALGKKVIILAVPDSLSKDLMQIVDEVLFYKVDGLKNEVVEKQPKNIAEISDFILETLEDLEQKSYNARWVNLAALGLKLHQRDPTFTHKKYQYGKLVEMLADISGIELKFDGHEKTSALARTSQDKNPLSASTTLMGEILSLHEGYGFIKSEKKGENVFFHHSKLVNCSFVDLSPGDMVTYTTYKTERGDNAENITKVES